MSLFRKKPITQPAEAEANSFRAAREAKRTTLAAAARELGISESYLAAIESGNLSRLPPGVYAKQFRKRYAAWLGLALSAEDPDTPVPAAAPDPFSRKVPSTRYFLTIPKLLRNLTIGIAIAAFFGYLISYAVNVTAPPILSLDSPAADLTVTEAAIVIRGTTEPEAEVRINGDLALTDQQGGFSASVNLRIGVNIVTVAAKRRYGRTVTVVRKILVAEPAAALPNGG